MTIVTLVGATLAFCLSVTVFWANPTRFTNQIFSAIWWIFAIWFGLVHQGVIAEDLIASGHAANAVPWLRANAALISFAPSLVWMLKESIASGSTNRSLPLRRSAPIFAISIVLAGLCYNESFILPATDLGRHPRGRIYTLYIIIQLIIYACMIIDCIVQTRRLRGIRRLELQLLALTTGTTCLVATTLVGVGNFISSTPVRRSSFFVILSGFAVTAWVITAHRIFDTKQVLLSLGQRLVVVAALGFSAIGLAHLIETFASTSVALFTSIAVTSALGFFVDRKSREWLKLTGEDILTRMRSAIIDLARTEPNPEKLVAELEALLIRQSQASFVALLFADGSSHARNRLKPDKDHLAYSALCDLGWATPEALQRRRSTPALDALKHHLYQHSLGLILLVPRGSPNPSLIVAFGTRINEWPYTYPEVQRFQNAIELMDNILTRSRLTTQAALKAKTEHLAMMSRGLAHDLKNLLTPVSSFLVHTEGRFPAESAEAEVHGAAQRSIRLMGEYVREARFFAEQLTPRFEPASLAELFKSVREITGPRTTERGVSVTTTISGEGPVIVDRVLIQRLLGNLVANAIDASSAGQVIELNGDVQNGRLQLQVTDRGCGIAPEHLGRIFEAYFTTKEFGDEVRGFGRGLTICQKIVALHSGEISVQSELGKGSTFTVEMPSSPAAPAIVNSAPSVAPAPDSR